MSVSNLFSSTFKGTPHCEIKWCSLNEFTPVVFWISSYAILMCGSTLNVNKAVRIIESLSVFTQQSANMDWYIKSVRLLPNSSSVDVPAVDLQSLQLFP